MLQAEEHAAQIDRDDVAVNNAGTEGRFAPLQDMSAAEFDNIIAVNLRGMFLGLKHEISHMKAHGGGAIVNMSSNAGLKAIANIAIYTASKHGVAGMTKAAALETRASIRINAVAPGAVETGLLHRMVDGHVPIAAIAESTPMGRISQPDEIARAIRSGVGRRVLHDRPRHAGRWRRAGGIRKVSVRSCQFSNDLTDD